MCSAVIAFRSTGLFAGLLLFTACSGAQTSGAPVPEGSYPPAPLPTVEGAEAIEAAVRVVLDEQVAAWNNGDVRGFMEGYARHDSLVFISGGTLRRGWQENLYAYMRNYPDRSAMGTLSFEDLRFRVLSPEYALVYGIWRLRRADDEPLGLFTLLFRETHQGWRIVHDHTSSSP